MLLKEWSGVKKIFYVIHFAISFSSSRNTSFPEILSFKVMLITEEIYLFKIHHFWAKEQEIASLPKLPITLPKYLPD